MIVLETKSETLIKNISDDQSLSNEGSNFLTSAINEVLIVAVTNPYGIITHVNEKFCKISGYTREELIGKTHNIVNSGYHSKSFFRRMYRTIENGTIWRGNICNQAKDGSLYWVATTIIPRCDSAGKILSFIALRFDITAEITARHEVNRLARQDVLVEALNRIGFSRELAAILQPPYAKDQKVALATIDLDNFKEVNDLYGHEAGDTVLRVIARRMIETCGSYAIIGRLGGDEFALFWQEESVPSQFQKKLSDLRRAIEQPIMIEAVEVSVSASIGYVQTQLSQCNIETIMRESDLALMAAKKQNKAEREIVKFTERLGVETQRHQQLLIEARQGLQFNQFVVHYQPVLDLKTGTVKFCEALLRWHHPTLGLLSASKFQEVFSDFSITKRIGKLVRETVVRDLSNWRTDGRYFGGVSLNLIGADFEGGQIVNELSSLVQQYDLTRDRLILEVTESLFLGTNLASRVRQDLTALAKSGFPVAFDDFGTGYASLTHLRELPLSFLKIDRSFVTNIEENIYDRRLATGIVELAHRLDLGIVAEGVETTEQFKILRQIGCDSVQGYLFARPTSEDQLFEEIKKSEETLENISLPKKQKYQKSCYNI
ncbi:EAL domain-containing protein (plasmid) [Kozakia baliensis]|uniref:sensor domain-containing protein n=1 Tax=Kozakia baliensis TaxID=153496 RepID=UPI00345C1803